MTSKTLYACLGNTRNPGLKVALRASSYDRITKPAARQREIHDALLAILDAPSGARNIIIIIIIISITIVNYYYYY